MWLRGRGSEYHHVGGNGLLRHRLATGILCIRASQGW
jgi:hypothetical protein